MTAAPAAGPAVPGSADADGGPARYRLFGLAVETDRSLPDLPPVPDDRPPELRIWLGRVPPDVFPPLAEEHWYLSPRLAAGEEPTVEAWRRADGGFRLRYADDCEYHVDAAGTAVACTWPARFTPEDAATYLLGPVLGLVLRLRGVPALHASAVSVGGRALALCGPPRAGKSTTAAALAARGHPLVADDVLALPLRGGGIEAQPAYPHLRLWPDVVAPLFGPGAELPPLTPNWDKRLLRLDADFHPDPLPLGAVYLLAAREEGADAPRLEPVGGAEAVLALVSNAYVGWFPGRAAQARELEVLGRVARTVPVLRATPHADPARLGELCALLEADFRARMEGGAVAETYTIRGHAAMLADRVRMDAYAAALEAVVRPGSVVLDVGTGTGMFALLACRLGARRVYAIDPGDSIHLARAAARGSGYGDRIEFIQGLSTETELPERAEVMVSDLRGVLPFQHHLPAVIDARERLLVPGATLVPRTDSILAAPVEAPDEHHRIVSPWDEHARGFDLSMARRSAVNSWGKARVRPAQLVAPAETWTVLDYRAVREPDVRGTLEWSAARAGAAHGIALWFHAELAEGIGFTTGPEGEETIYGTGFLPWPRAVALARGDAVRVELQARLVGADYVWVWDTQVRRADGSAEEFRQSTFLSQPFSPETLRRQAHDHRPVLGEQGRIDQAVLGMMDGGATLEQIARELRRRFPERFSSWEQALARAGRLSGTYSA